MANLYIVGSRATGVLIVKTDPLRVVHISKQQIENKASESGKAYDTLFDEVMAGAQKAFVPEGSGGSAPSPDFSYAAEVTDGEFDARRWRALPIAQAVGSAGEEAGAAEYAARRWRSLFGSDESGFASRRWRGAPGKEIGAAEFSARRWRDGAEATGSAEAVKSAAYTARRWRAAVEMEAGGEFAEYAAWRWRAAPDDVQFLDVAEFAVRRWRSMPPAGGSTNFDARRFRTAEEETAAKDTTDYAMNKWGANPDADALVEAQEFVARRWRSIDGIVTGEAAKEHPVTPGLDP